MINMKEVCIPKDLKILLESIEDLKVDGFKAQKTRHIIRVLTSKNRSAIYSLLQKKLKTFGHFTYSDSRTYSRSSGHLENDRYVIVLKPTVGATENLKVKSNQLTSLGKKVQLTIQGKRCEFYEFTCRHALQENILIGLRNNPKIPRNVITTFSKYFDQCDCLGLKDFNLQWHKSLSDNDKNEIGKNLGELLTGLFAFEGYLLPKAKKFLIPVSARFPMIDSVIIDEQSKAIPISNKFGRPGAAASFLSNVLPLVAEVPKETLKHHKALSRLVASHKRIGAKNAKGILYDCGLRSLGLKINDPLSIYRNLVKGKYTQQVLEVIRAIKETGPDAEVLKHLNRKSGYASVTGFFSRSIGGEINASEKSLRLIESLLAKKKFVQVNIDHKPWLTGKIELEVIPSNQFSVRMHSKSAPGDISASQGMLNYTIRKKS
jgi:hypothetical protein